MPNYNPPTPFSKGDFVKSPLTKGDLGGCDAVFSAFLAVNYYQKNLFSQGRLGLCRIITKYFMRVNIR